MVNAPALAVNGICSVKKSHSGIPYIKAAGQLDVEPKDVIKLGLVPMYLATVDAKLACAVWLYIYMYVNRYPYLF